MLRFSANLSTLFGELPLIERPAAAARAGFEAVEVWFSYEVPARDFRDALTASGVTCIGINTAPGDMQRGDVSAAASALERVLRMTRAPAERALAAQCAAAAAYSGKLCLE